ncbi:MAG: hypothetical protein RL133_1257 [Pseudomonadota bacterium]
MQTSGLLEELRPVVAAILKQRPPEEQDLTLTAAVRMAGGAINQNFLVELSSAGGQTRQWVLRRGQAKPVPGTHNRATEFRLFAIAHRAGLCVPQPLGLLETQGQSVSAFERAEGEADPRSIMAWMKAQRESDPTTTERFGQAAAFAFGEQLGRLHSASRERSILSPLEALLGPAPASGVDAAMTGLRASLGLLHAPESYLRYAVEQLIADRPVRPESQPAVLCHNDFRLGNLMLHLPKSTVLTDTPVLSAVLDWEFAFWSDPMADIGWLTAPCWRFGGEGEVAGIGSLRALLEGYESTDPAGPLPLDELPYWQRFAQMRWALIAAQQGERAVPGEHETLELRVTGAMAASLAQPVVEHYLGHRVEPLPMPQVQAQWGHARDLLQAAAHHLRSEMPADISQRARYGSLMASNAIRLAYNHLLLASAKPEHPEGNPVELDLAQDLAIWGFRGFP